MEALQKLMDDLGRYLLLEGQLPHLTQEAETLRREALALERDLGEKRRERDRLMEPGWFQRLLGSIQEKQEDAHRAFREAEAALLQGKQRYGDAKAILASTRAELEALAGAKDRYLAVKESDPLLPRLAENALAPAALDSAKRCLAALEEAVPLAHKEAQLHPDSVSGEKLDCFAAARTEAERLRWMLQQMPEPERRIGGYLANPDYFLLALAMKYSRLDRLNEATAQLHSLCKELEALV